MKKMLDSTDAHKRKRVEFARQHAPQDLEWSTVLFSDKIQFNLDGPEGCKFEWTDGRGQKKTYVTWHSGGGFLTVWGGIGAAGKTDLASIETTINSPNYVEVLT